MEYNSSLFNPAFSLYGNNPQSVAFWGRWQWQSIDADPTTYFLNYTRKINAVSGFGVAFFQHNTTFFLNTGGVANYAYAFRLSDRTELALGVNVFGYSRKLADEFIDPDPILPLPEETADFIFRVAPGLLLKADNWDLGLAWENLIDYNLSDSEKASGAGEKIFLGSVGVEVPVSAFGFTEDTYVKPLLYYKTIPNLDNQIGLNTLFSTPKFWVQGGYNSFYGISAGLGGRFFSKLSVGLLWEFSTSSDLSGSGSSVEVVTAFFIGPQYFKEKEKLPEEEEIPEEPEELITEADQKKEEDAAAEALALQQEEEARQAQIAREEQLKDSLNTVRMAELAAAERAREEFVRDSLNTVRLAEVAAAEKAREEFVRDSLSAVRRAEVEAIKQAREEFVRDSLNAVRLAEVEAAKRAREEFVRDSVNRVKIAQAEAARKARQEFVRDSLQTVRLAREEEERLAREAFVKDSLEKAAIAQAEQENRLAEAEEVVQQEEVTPEQGEKYQEVDSADGLQPGFYLIANVFGTKRYYESFMKDLTDRGLDPKSFYRSDKKYNYVYLQRYNTIQEARRARDSKFNGRYQGDTWIFRVVGR